MIHQRSQQRGRTGLSRTYPGCIDLDQPLSNNFERVRGYLDQHDHRRFRAHSSRKMTSTTFNKSTVLISTKRYLAGPHLYPHAIHRCHKPATHNWHDPLKHRVFMPFILLTRHQRQKHNTGCIIAGTRPPNTCHSLDKCDQLKIIQPLLLLMTHPFMITPDMPNMKSRIDFGRHGAKALSIRS